MAGISFELRRVLKKRSLLSIFSAFGYSFALSSGPYFITILSLILINFVLSNLGVSGLHLVQFQTAVTHIIAFSLILSGFTNLYLIRFIADMLFMKKHETILPNMMGAMLMNMYVGFFASLVFGLMNFQEDSRHTFSLVFAYTFGVFMGLWVLNMLLTGFKSYKYILFSYGLSYITLIPLAVLLRRYELTGLMLSFALSNTLLFILLLTYIVRNYYSKILLSFDFLKENNYRVLILTGFFYNLGLWADKLVFWYHPYTRTQVLGPLSYSVVYDIPVFLAYLAIAPGISIMFLKLEYEFAEKYDKYYRAVREGAPLDMIYLYGDELIFNARAAVIETLRIQVVFSIFVVLIEEILFTVFKIPNIYIPLFEILLLGTTLLVVLLIVIALMFYFNLLEESAKTTAVFAFSNLVFSFITIMLGPYYYGYGFAVSVMITIVYGILLLRRFLHEIHYYTFMHA